jgi:hypothetical protein
VRGPPRVQGVDDRLILRGDDGIEHRIEEAELLNLRAPVMIMRTVLVPIGTATAWTRNVFSWGAPSLDFHGAQFT